VTQERLTWTERARGAKLVESIHRQVQGTYSKRRIKQAIERGQCRINGNLVFKAVTPVPYGATLNLHLNFLKCAPLRHPFEADRVLYEDEWLLAYDKPPCVMSDEEGLISIVREQYPDAQLGHRLDGDTSGILLFSKSIEHVEMVTDLFRQRLVKKTYLALVDGNPKQRSGTVEKKIGRKAPRDRQPIWGVDAAGKEAVTQWQVSKSYGKASLLECRPATGRTHQIRIHLADLGHPVLGDHRYGGQFQCKVDPWRHLLHASRVAFPHPITDDSVEITAPMPEDFKTYLDAVSRR
jgi:RluA family pseudouridine synthase